ncbi:hypothetical protein NDU88_006598 [Pleurodeles waltl]|uniref:Uncharacterized protein n=1 Tax=Pleurodeles waltl TaxID=8319 RepID=A0AAV7SQ46_PLEWA|nr:hypothetical protein NDU88_006598 [Pleurodeles waltl]
MGKVDCKKDPEVEDDTTVNAMAGPQGTKNTHPVEGNGDPTLQDILQAITASHEVLEGKIDALATDLNVLRDDHRCLAKKVSTAEKQVKEILL